MIDRIRSGLVLLLIFSAACAFAAEVEQTVLDRACAYFQSVTCMKFHFEQNLENITAAGGNQASGTIWIAPPDKIRWQYTDPEKYHLVAQGDQVSMVVPEDRQVYHGTLHTLFDSNNPWSLLFQNRPDKIREDFEVTHLPKRELSSVLLLTPQKPLAGTHAIEFVVADDGSVEELTIIDENGSRNRFRFSEFESGECPKNRFTVGDVAGFAWFNLLGEPIQPPLGGMP